jgi:hypothetical protein
MIRIRGPDQTQQIDNPALRRLVEKRFYEICDGEAYEAEIHGEMLLAEPGDSLASLEQESGCSVSTNVFDESKFPEPDFVPACEVIEEHATCFEMVFILNDDGFGISIFVPKQPDIDQNLLSLCRTYAVKPLQRRRS